MKKILTKRRVILLILTIACVISVFLFSSRNADVSTEQSHAVEYLISNIFVKDFKDLTPEEQLRFVESIDKPVRKTAHAVEYATLAILLFATIGPEVKKRFRLPVTLVITFAYSMTDEYHQTFVSGRSGELRDAVNDLGGAFVGLVLAVLIPYMIGKVRNRKLNQKENVNK